MFKRTFLLAALCCGLGLSAHAQDAMLGPIMLSGAWARPTVPGQPAGGGFVTLMNHGKSADRLLGASTPVAGSVELHSMTMEGNVMRMHELAGGIALAPGATVALQPGSLHMMFMNLKQPLALGTKVPVTLQFEKAGKVTVDFVVKAQPPGGMPMHQH